MKQAQPKKSFAEAIEDRVKSMQEIKREKLVIAKNNEFRAQEEEVMLMTHGPDWRKYYAGEPRPKEEENIPPALESEVRLKAS